MGLLQLGVEGRSVLRRVFGLVGARAGTCLCPGASESRLFLCAGIQVAPRRTMLQVGKQRTLKLFIVDPGVWRSAPKEFGGFFWCHACSGHLRCPTHMLAAGARSKARTHYSFLVRHLLQYFAIVCRLQLRLPLFRLLSYNQNIIMMKKYDNDY